MDLAPLRRFTAKIERIKRNLPATKIEVIKLLAKQIESEIRITYPLASVSIISLDPGTDRATAVISVYEKDLWFKEFGTGFEGMGSFPHWEYRPQMTLTFFSRGEMQTTIGWEYAYHPLTRKEFGWMYNGQWQIGQRAQAGVTNAIVRIKYNGIPELATLIRDYLGRG